LFVLNIAWFLGLFAYLAFGGAISASVLFVSDVLQLDLYLVALALHGRVLLSESPQRRR
jgi:hypothetical protein